MSKAIEYGIRGKAQKNVVQTHGKAKKPVIDHSIQGSASKAIERNIKTPKSPFELGLTGRGIKGIDH